MSNHDVNPKHTEPNHIAANPVAAVGCWGEIAVLLPVDGIGVDFGNTIQDSRSLTSGIVAERQVLPVGGQVDTSFSHVVGALT